MRPFLLATLCLIISAPVLAQNADDPATKDDVILLFQTMHSHDMLQRVMDVESKTMQQMFRDEMAKQKGTAPDAGTRSAKMMDEFLKDMPMDEMMQAMIPAYQKHFTHGDIEAMNAFYSSPVGQKVLEELPVVMQEGMQEMMPLVLKYVDQWKQKMKQEIENSNKPSTATQKDPAAQN
jgi:uncharacterized protein